MTGGGNEGRMIVDSKVVLKPEDGDAFLLLSLKLAPAAGGGGGHVKGESVTWLLKAESVRGVGK